MIMMIIMIMVMILMMVKMTMTPWKKNDDHDEGVEGLLANHPVDHFSHTKRIRLISLILFKIKQSYAGIIKRNIKNWDAKKEENNQFVKLHWLERKLLWSQLKYEKKRRDVHLSNMKSKCYEEEEVQAIVVIFCNCKYENKEGRVQAAAGVQPIGSDMT